MTDLTPPLPAPAPADRFLSWPAVRAITGLSRTTIWRLQKTGEFPRAVRISPGRIAWRASEVSAWLNPSAGALPAAAAEAVSRQPPPNPLPSYPRPRERTRARKAGPRSQLTLGF